MIVDFRDYPASRRRRVRDTVAPTGSELSMKFPHNLMFYDRILDILGRTIFVK